MKAIKIYEQQRVVYLARAEDDSGTALTTSDVDIIMLNVWKDGTDSSDGFPVYSTSFTPSEVMYDSLQLPWNEDVTGYNLRIVIPSTALDKGGALYTCEVYVLRNNDEGPLPAKFQIKVENMRTRGAF